MARNEKSDSPDAQNDFKDWLVDLGLKAFDRFAAQPHDTDTKKGPIAKLAGHWNVMDAADKKQLLNRVLAGAELLVASASMAATAAGVRKAKTAAKTAKSSPASEATPADDESAVGKPKKEGRKKEGKGDKDGKDKKGKDKKDKKKKDK